VARIGEHYPTIAGARASARNAVRLRVTLRMPTPRIAVVVPCYNTASLCAEVIGRAAPFADAILAVDDGSTDDTAEQLRASRCHVLRLPVNAGKGAALAAGFREVLKGADGMLGLRADYVITLDGDGQHDPADIPRLVDRAQRSGADLVLGVRDPRAMPRKNRIGAHFSRLLFLIGTSTFVADTQSGFRLLTLPLLDALIDRVTWRGYESESEVLWRTLALGRGVSAVEISTIYIDGNRRTRFNPWRDSVRIASVFTRQLRWTVSMAILDFAVFAALSLTGRLSPAMTNVGSRLAAVVCQASFRRDYVARTRALVRREGLGWCLLAFGGHLGATTLLVVALVGLGMPPILAKAAAQLVGYLGSFAAVDHVLLGRVTRASG
jgi:glycosyltransferase involved in cell wall biosynthesis